MFFDDRLATVLRQEGNTDAARRTQFRQLLDILGNRKFGPAGRSDPSLVAAAWLRMDALERSLSVKERAAMIREPSWRFRSADLAAHLADFEPEVASAALNRAELSEEDWVTLIPRLPVRARGFLRLRKDLPPDALALLDRLGVQDRGLPLPSGSSAEAEIIEEAPSEPDSPDQVEPQPECAPSPAGEPSSQAEPLDLEPEAEVEPGAEIEDTASKIVPLTPEHDPEAPRKRASRPKAPDPIETGRSEISALVERIAQFKRTRETSDADELNESERSPRLPLGETEATGFRRAHSFGFCADAAGRIDWAEASVASMVIGTKLIAPHALGEDSTNVALERAFFQRQPMVDLPTELAGAPAIAGEWSVDAQPRFTREGHFSGYVGRFCRLPEDDEDENDEAAQEADRIRQLLHELRTPVTAVQGYAEVIQQQLFGPAPHEYRALAAAIAADAARILAGFEELDRLARLEIGALTMEPGEADLAAIVQQTQRQLTQVLSPRMASLSVEIPAGDRGSVKGDGETAQGLAIPLDPQEAELLIWRLMATLGGACDAGEALTSSLEACEEDVRLSCDLPRQLLIEPDIFATEAKPAETAINAGVFGAGFALRLARAEARAIGGNLTRYEDRLVLTLPRLEQGQEETAINAQP
ncbi:MAG: histidine kinase dimerization/phospho-acceptor domain-containing protein [Pseudomonadota bacterium]